MLLKLVSIFLWTMAASAIKGHQDWEIAVVINDQIELLQSNGMLIGSTMQQFTKLKALTFDNVRHQFVVSDMDHDNDTIFTVQLTKETEITPIVPDLPDDVQGLAIDPIEDILYWTDSVNNTINYIKLNDSDSEPQLLFAFSNVIPQDVVIDVCRRYIYWTNCYVNEPTIERSFLNGSNREVVVSSDLKSPAGIAIDYKRQRLYWADMREGIYYRIDSSNLNGGDREIVYEGSHNKPFGIAVDETSIYWTDINNNALWRYYKSDRGSPPQKIREFKERPLGLVAKNVQIRNYPDCKELEVAIEKYGDREESFDSYKEAAIDSTEVTECLNGGEQINNYCKCRRGYTGRNCEIDNCHNFCIHGTCHLSTQGYPMCYCPKGFGGTRCELDMCKSFCLNDGECSYSKGDLIPSCRCSEHYTGSRCEISTEFSNLCLMYCRENTSENDYLISKNRDLICRCTNQDYVISKNNLTASALLSKSNEPPEANFITKLVSDSDYSVLAALLLMSVLVIIFLTGYILARRRRRKDPAPSRRIIVRPNVTPLTYRPQPTNDHCEITIENCCNMNVCETPCYEPSSLRNKNKEDQKTLLTNMENGEDAY
ncbi:protein cueball [Sitophilus oryzae]|uniref:Protein cueball n=1 Tax=Sitophilus oryzae TaxID=7048 RepID=A0A6J2YQI6_SITOR|nr:protein cueball [Sitophilus oryzae]